MAMVFSKDVLFIHVHKAGGTSVTSYLLDALERPVRYVSRASVEGDDPGLIHIHGNPHQRLAEARDFVRTHGFALEEFPLILAVVRNPYDIFVSHYAWQKLRTTDQTILAPEEAPPPPPPKPVSPRMAAAVAALRPGAVARITPDPGETVRAVRDDFHRAAIAAGRRVETWGQDGLLYAAPTDRGEKLHRSRQLAQGLGFRDFAIEANKKKHTFLNGLFGFYHLDGRMPANLKIVKFERMATEIPAALAAIGIAGAGEFPWLNRSARGATADYYDAETEAIVYDQARWLFDGGFYERLPVGAARPTTSMLPA